MVALFKEKSMFLAQVLAERILGSGEFNEYTIAIAIS